eukprot:218682-Amphidinium_carterae.1
MGLPLTRSTTEAVRAKWATPSPPTEIAEAIVSPKQWNAALQRLKRGTLRRDWALLRSDEKLLHTSLHNSQLTGASPSYQWTWAELKAFRFYKLAASSTVQAAIRTTLEDLAARARCKA